MGTPLWATLLTMLIALTAVAFTFIATRDAAILRAPDFEIVFHDEQNLHGAVNYRILNRGKVDAFDVEVAWAYDPLGRLHDKDSWKAPRIRAGEFHVATLQADIGESNTAHRFLTDLTRPDNATGNPARSAAGEISYRNQLSWFRRRTKHTVWLSKPDATYQAGIDRAQAQEDKVTAERMARNPPNAG